MSILLLLPSIMLLQLIFHIFPFIININQYATNQQKCAATEIVIKSMIFYSTRVSIKLLEVQIMRLKSQELFGEFICSPKADTCLSLKACDIRKGCYAYYNGPRCLLHNVKRLVQRILRSGSKIKWPDINTIVWKMLMEVDIVEPWISFPSTSHT